MFELREKGHIGAGQTGKWKKSVLRKRNKIYETQVSECVSLVEELQDRRKKQDTLWWANE